jgi:trehalose 2-sulfotransferase
MSKVSEIFNNAQLDEKRLAEIEKLADPRGTYIIAMTPRSGSSYLCDVMKTTKRFGTPDEVLNEGFVPNILQRIPGKTPDEYLRNVFRVRKTANGISGLKASWFQFNNFVTAMSEPQLAQKRRFVYLTRRDLPAQAISLYKATASDVFHTNKQHDTGALQKLQELEYDYEKIEGWLHHIAKQEAGWRAYFAAHSIFPLVLTHEEIDADILGVLKRIATYVGVDPKNVELPAAQSVFTKVSDTRNAEWAERFSTEYRQKHAGRTALSASRSD